MNRTLTIAIAAVAAASSYAGSFTPGNIVVYRSGDGSTPLSGAAFPVFLDEYTPAGVLVQSIAMPTVANGNNKQYTDSGFGTTSGLLNRSVDKKFLTMAGYDAVAGTASIGTTDSSIVNRVVGMVKFDGTVDTSTSFDSYNGGAIRSAVTVDGTGFWTGGTGGSGKGLTAGVRYVPYGPGQTPVMVCGDATTYNNVRFVSIFNGQLYCGAQTNVYRGVSQIGTGLPTTGGQSITLLPGFDPSTGSTQNTYQYQFVDANTLYIADINATPSGGLQKWVYDSGLAQWTKMYTISGGLPGANGIMGMTVVPGTNANTVYVTAAPANGQATPSALLSVVDTGTGLDTFTNLMTAPANEFFHGVALAPEGAAQPVTLTPTAFNVGLGAVASGNLASLASDDANALKVCKAFVPNFASPRIRVDATFVSPYLTASSLKLDMKARMTTGGSFKVRGFLADTSGAGTFAYGAPNQVIADTSIALTFATYTSGAVATGTHIDTDADATADGTIVARTEIQQTGFSAVAVPCAEWEYINVTVTP